LAANSINIKKTQIEIKESLVSKGNHVIVEVSDLQLWHNFQMGSEAAFASIYNANAERLYGYGLKLVKDKDLVKDCIQDLFVELWDTKHNLSSVRSIKAYLFKCIRRKLIARAAKLRKRFDLNIDLDLVRESTPSAEINLIEKQRFEDERSILAKTLKKLNSKQREIIHLKFYGNLRYDEISEIMALDKRGTYNLMAHTIKLLRRDLGRVILFVFLLFLTFY
jgi:RNA polymerase sigma-70 factor (ECF subfamily)